MGKILGGLFGGGMKIPAIPPPPPPPPPPQYVDPAIAQAGQSQRARAVAAAGVGSTILTSPQGLTEQAQTAKKTLLGQ